ncbi:hypothetical protein QY049_12905 [Bradyrhizobium sp. WYCCWR 13022]|uniref:hypothetical protein n=1 Tax=unclassified Bradyrhizobium TaxID=2631580 RepID=UPI00263AE150|nr:hypothetical protein [Bradyrhizobium sp. WYCCWR 13022]MDN4984128.1 hypothetical protein [Bradyrhizobium sp. WYCCWR 13022]
MEDEFKRVAQKNLQVPIMPQFQSGLRGLGVSQAGQLCFSIIAQAHEASAILRS